MTTQKNLDAVRQMVTEWLKKDGGDREKTARWMAYTLHMGSLPQCRDLIRKYS